MRVQGEVGPQSFGCEMLLSAVYVVVPNLGAI
ncbi:hypothetical protein KPHVMX_340054 [Klebsiella pneumoniae]|nr:hypothetical protein KPHVMX_340054 [Klebsiella pneumoniae]